jgi:pimeloyl-ACP methyl ester carboxylesterase
MGMSHGGWLALHFAIARPERVGKLVLLSPGGILPWTKQWTLRAMLMAIFPTRFTVESFMRWAGFTNRPGDLDAPPTVELIYLGLKHFRIPNETRRIIPAVFSDRELQTLEMPVLLLFGEDEVMYDAAKALARARQLIRNLEGDLIPNCRHEMCFSQRRIVDSRARKFLKETMQQSVA